jgi:hypothetical protein
MTGDRQMRAHGVNDTQLMLARDAAMSAEAARSHHHVADGVRRVAGPIIKSTNINSE